MRIGSITTAFINSCNGKFDYVKMKTLGYDFCDYQGLIHGNTKAMFNNGSYEEILKEIKSDKAQINNAGISISQVHGPWITNDSTDESRKRETELAKKAVKLTGELGGEKNLVIHPKMISWDKEDANNYKLNIDFFSDLCRYAKDYDVNICIENMPFKELEVSYIKTIRKIVDEVKMPNFYICLDTGHQHICGDEIGKSIRLCGDKLRVLHIHDNNGKADEHLLPYEGTIDWESFKSGLKDIKFEGVLSVETGINDKIPNPFKDNLRKILADLINSFWK